MKYIRLKGGFIHTKEFWNKLVDYAQEKGHSIVDVVVKEADSIEELIMPDDLVEYDGIYYSRIEKDRGDYFVGYDKRVLEKSLISALYVAREKDAEIEVRYWALAARKNEKEEWELL